ncbi:hypothetical protein XENOCAPTIV_005849 [Xenoophorus captivus]|uniref:Uncharacterized protein n=1 Tax=Xenoophorus captivus TaxID=1517983 RepID=A0ABV0R2E0_9TELE
MCYGSITILLPNVVVDVNPQPARGLPPRQVVPGRVAGDHTHSSRCSRCWSLPGCQQSVSVNRASAWSRLMKSEEVHQLLTRRGMLTVCELS